jgi:(p)ppGpp synthase/HD superfamily hydrolase
LEDSNEISRTETDLVNEFGDHIYHGVVKLSDPPGDNRKQRKKRHHQELELIEDDSLWGSVLVVKAADRLANMRNCVATENKGLMRMYCREHEEFKQACQRPGRAEDIWEELDQLYETHRTKRKKNKKK